MQDVEQELRILCGDRRVHSHRLSVRPAELRREARQLLKRRHFSRSQLKLFNMMVPVLRRLDSLVPGNGLGIIAVATKPA